LNQPGYTASRFVADPFGVCAGERMFITGDIGAYDDHGTIQFGGRIDRQVKLRGQRIELEEIESAIADYRDVQWATVRLEVLENGERRIVACCVLAETIALDLDAIAAHLALRLPSYMIPKQWWRADDLPLTRNGKIALDKLWAAARLVESGPRELPGSDTEKQIAAIWTELLNTQHIALGDNFFALGGHSLLVMRLVSRLQNRFSISLPFRSILDYPTLRGLSDYVDALVWMVGQGSSEPCESREERA
jgi:acyl carrier protein